MADTTIKKVALVTGSTSGIGLGIAHRLAKTGYDVIITGLGDDTTIEEILADFRSKYCGSFTFVSGNLTAPDQIEKLCQEVLDKYPAGIDILVNNAGVNYQLPVDGYPLSRWTEMLAVNLTAPFLLTGRFLPFMKTKRWGRVVNTSSMLGIVSMERRVPYSTTKAGLIGMTKGVALECAEYGVTCNAICPGFVDTDLIRLLVEETAKAQSITFEEAKVEFFSARCPTRQPVTIEQVAGLVNYLCSDEAASITGTAVSIDAGYTAK